MKLKINKACDLSSISVLPPQSRRSNVIGSGTDTSVFGKSQASQLRSQQQSQQSFSQGMSSQLSQSSLDDILTNELRLGSQGENSARRTSCLAPVAYTRDDAQVQFSKSSNNHLRRWSSTPVQDHRCHVSEELEHRIGMIESSLNRFGMILDSVQGDVMQVNKAIKEVSLETEDIRKKLSAQDSSLQLMIKGEEDIKACLDGGLKCIPDQLRTDLHQYRLHETVSTLLSLPDLMGARLVKIQSEICGDITKELQAIASSIKPPLLKNTSPTLPPKVTGCHSQSQEEQKPAIKKRRGRPPKLQVDSEGFINPKQASVTKRQQNVKRKQDKIPLTEQDKERRATVESDEEIDVGFSCLFKEKETGFAYDLFDDVKGETERLLRKARRKRKCRNTIVLD